VDLAEARERTDSPGSSRHPWETARVDVVRRLIAGRVPLGSGSIVLDVGCGDTYVSEQLAACYPQSTFYAIDTAFGDELLARYRTRLAGSRVEPYAALDDVPLPGRPVSLVLLMDVIEHVEDACGLLRGLASRPYIDRDTRFLITVPAFQSLFCSHDTFLGHYRRYSNRLLREHAESAGLRVDDIGYFFFSLLPLRVLQVARERLAGSAGSATTTGLVTWGGSAAAAGAMRRVLVWDARVAFGLKRVGITLAGLSNYAVCRTSA
jgi:hypothetical protein